MNKGSENICKDGIMYYKCCLYFGGVGNYVYFCVIIT